jgi:2,3-bisphosphoglycerate-independent phosphoglycerate mutase
MITSALHVMYKPYSLGLNHYQALNAGVVEEQPRPLAVKNKLPGKTVFGRNEPIYAATQQVAIENEPGRLQMLSAQSIRAIMHKIYSGISSLWKAQQPVPARKPLVLLIFDGWGLRPGGPGNAIELANPPVYQRLLKTYPWVPLEASGEAVGLPKGQAGNSEVGHLTLGTGRVLYQDLPKIDKAIADGSFFRNPVFLQAVSHVRKTGGTLHLVGLVSDGGVHSHINHLSALIDFAKQQSVKNLRVHAFLDGRDTPPFSAQRYLMQVEGKLKQTGYKQIATIAGRYFAMDRDKRWDRIQKAYDNLVLANGFVSSNSIHALQSSYTLGQGDEFVVPTVTDPGYQGMNDGDAVLFFNFRPDRARQMTQALTDRQFTGFHRQKTLDNFYLGGMTLYDENFNLPVAFPRQRPANTLAEELSKSGIRQFRTAETEKYAHVTYFFNGGMESPYSGEDRFLIPSPKVSTYDLKPEMSIKDVTKEVVRALAQKQHEFIVANFANPDMVGHTGNQKAAVDAVKAVDESLGIIVQAVQKAKGVMLLTADHGKVEQMVDENGAPFTAHTRNAVPFVLISNDPKLKLNQSHHYGLSNVAPTILELFGLPKPAAMTAPSMLNKSSNPFA